MMTGQDVLIVVLLALGFAGVIALKVSHYRKSKGKTPQAELSAKDLADPRVAALAAQLAQGRPSVTQWSAGLKTLFFLLGFVTAGITWVVLIVQAVSSSRQARRAAVYDGRAYEEVQKLVIEMNRGGS
jgi:hypothetical protein